MRIIEKDEIHEKKEEIKSLLEEGKIFVYPTDTIYGIGCDATNERAVKKVREIKERQNKPFSIIAPSKEWILDHCEVGDQEMMWIGKLPGPYTLILKLKKRGGLAPSVNPRTNTIGVRMPDHWILDIVSDFGKPIITPSANVSGKEFMTSKEDMDPKIMAGTNILLYEGEKKGHPSTIVNLTEAEVSSSKKRKVI